MCDYSKSKGRKRRPSRRGKLKVRVNAVLFPGSVGVPSVLFAMSAECMQHTHTPVLELEEIYWGGGSLHSDGNATTWTCHSAWPTLTKHQLYYSPHQRARDQCMHELTIIPHHMWIHIWSLVNLKSSWTFQGIRNDRKSKLTNGVTGESDWSSFLIPCTVMVWVMPTAYLPIISCVTVSPVYLFMTAL